MERAARRVLDADLDLAESWALVAERPAASGAPPALAGYMRAWWRHFAAEDSQLMWMPADHLTCEIFFQFAAAADEPPDVIFHTLFNAMLRATLAPPHEPWVLSLVPPAAGLDPALTALGFRLTSVFAYRPRDPTPPTFPTPPGFHIRPAVRQDTPALVDLYADLCAYHVRNDPYADRIPPRLREEFGYVVRSVLAEPRRWVLLVVCADSDPATPRAFSMASLDTEDAAPAQITQLPPGTVGFIHDFMIAEALRGQGLGRALWAATLDALTARAPAAPPRGLHGTWLIYRPTNPTGARFWPALGYTPLYLMWRRGGWTRDEGSVAGGQ